MTVKITCLQNSAISVFFYKTKPECQTYGIPAPPCRNKGPYIGVKLIMKRSCNNYTNDKSKHKMCWQILVLCQGTSKLCHLQTVSYTQLHLCLLGNLGDMTNYKSSPFQSCLTCSLIYHFETVPNSKKLQTTIEIGL